jgi:hypothetical protein
LAVHDQDPIVKALVHKFDQNGIELKSKKTKDSADRPESNNEKVVSTMAKRATNKARG